MYTKQHSKALKIIFYSLKEKTKITSFVLDRKKKISKFNVPERTRKIPEKKFQIPNNTIVRYCIFRTKNVKQTNRFLQLLEQ